MIYKMFCIYDSKIEAYNRPFTARSKGEAIRSLITEASNSESPLAKHAADYTLFEIGEFNDDNGIITPSHALENLGLIQDLLVS